MAAKKAAAVAAEKKIILIGAENIGAFSPLLGDAFQPGRIGLGCLVGEEVAGAAVFSVTDGLCTMDSILVREKFRRQGIGRLLFTEAAQTFRESGVTHFMANFGRIDGMTEFLRSIGFTVVTSGHVCLVDLKTLADAALVRRVLREAAETRRVLPYSKLNMNQKKELQIKARAFGFSPELWAKGAIHPELSFAMVRGGHATGMLLSAREGDDFLVSLLMNTDRNKTTLPLILSHFLAAALKKAKKDSMVRFFEKQKAMEHFLTYLMKDVKDPYKIVPCSVGIWGEDYE